MIGKVVDGTPIIVIADGKPDEHVMHKMLLTDEDLLTAARERGLMRLE